MLIKFRIIFSVSVLFFTFSFTCYGADEPQLSASSAVLIDGDTFEILYEKNAHEKRSMASTTKIMTSLLAVESGKLSEIVSVKEKIYIEGTAIGFNKGDELTLEALCYAMLLESGNDAAVLTAQYLAGSEKDFSVLMNEKAAEIGMENTNFVTASGLDDENHYTTAYDMSLLGANAVKNEKFREICSSKSYKADFINPQITRHFSNHNRLLTSCEGVFGLKTGFTKKSGRCLVSACERNGKILVAVTLKAPDDWNDHKKLYDYGYALYDETEINPEIPAINPIFGSDKKSISLKSAKSNTLMTLKGSEISYKILINPMQYAPVQKNDIVGKVIILQNGKPVAQHFVVADEDAAVLKDAKIKKQTLGQRLKLFFKNLLKKGR